MTFRILDRNGKVVRKVNAIDLQAIKKELNLPVTMQSYKRKVNGKEMNFAWFVRVDCCGQITADCEVVY
jgi:hypothetical protein